MRIKEYLSEETLKELNKNKKSKNNKSKKKNKERITEKDILELMQHSTYKRGKGGAMRQVR